MSDLTAHIITSHLLKTFPDIKMIDTWGECSFFYNPGNLSPRGTYFCTIKEKDGDNDKASELNRENVFRLNFGIKKTTFLERFNQIPKRPSKGGIIEGSYDFTQLDTLYPHPVYGWMCWIAILNPSQSSWNKIICAPRRKLPTCSFKHKSKKL